MPTRRGGGLPRMPRLAPMRGFQRLPQPATLASTQPRTDAGASQPHDPTAPPPTPPAAWRGTAYEWTVYGWLRGQAIPFTTRYDTPTGPPLPDARNQATHPTFVVGDRSPGLVIEVLQEQGYAGAGEAQATVVRKSTLEASGYTYVAVRASDLQARPDETLSAALDGAQLF